MSPARCGTPIMGIEGTLFAYYRIGSLSVLPLELFGAEFEIFLKKSTQWRILISRGHTRNLCNLLNNGTKIKNLWLRTSLTGDCLSVHDKLLV